MVEKSGLKMTGYSLERLGHLYFWSDAEKAKFIADVTCLVFLISGLGSTLLDYLQIDNLHVGVENLPWARNIAFSSALVFFIIRILAMKFAENPKATKILLISNMAAMSICLPLYFSTIGMFDGFCWLLLFVSVAVGFVLLEPRYIFRTQVATLMVMMSISFLDEYFPYQVRAYIVSEHGYISDFSQIDLLYIWTVMITGSMIGVLTLGYLTGAWQRREQDLRSISYIDELTSVMNRRSVLEALNMEFQIAREQANRLSLAMLDLDHFKKINDSYGHQFGDKVLKAVAEQTQKICRRHDLVGRYGGEEFLVVFPACPGEQAVNVLNRLREKLAELEFFSDSGEQVKITLSAGVAEMNESDQSLTDFIERADIALYKAKAAGRDRVLAA